jgi:hypothetical protein
MSYFAKIEEGVVVNVVAVATDNITDADGNESEELGSALLNSGGDSQSLWKRTSYNTHGGKHYNPETREEDDGVPFRVNYAGIGYIYDEDRDAFYLPQPFPSWSLDEDTCYWVPPTPPPEVEMNEEGVPKAFYQWNESDQTWDEVEMPSE